MASSTISCASLSSALPVCKNTFTVKVTDGNDTRRFACQSTSFSQLCEVVRNLFGISPNTPLLLKYKDDEGDLITCSSDTELEEAVKLTNKSIVHLTLIRPCAKAPAVPVAKVPQPKAPAVPVAKVPQPTPAPAGLVAKTVQPLPAPAPVPVTPKGKGMAHGAEVPEWKKKRMEAMAAWKEEKAKLKEQIKLLKQNHSGDKQALKQQIAALRSRVQEQAIELRRVPKENLMIARFVKDITVPDGTEVAPGATFVKTWRLRNDSAKAWPAGSKLLWVGKACDRMGAPDSVPVPGEPLQPGQEINISVPLVAPTQAGRYTAYFRLAGPMGKKFGQRIWVQVQVYESSSSEGEAETKPVPTDEMARDMVKYATALQALNAMGFTKLRVNLRLLKKHDGNLERVVAQLIKRQQRIAAISQPTQQ